MKRIKILLLGMALMVLSVIMLPSESEAVVGKYICGNCASSFNTSAAASNHAQKKKHNVYFNNGGIMWCNAPIEL